MILELSESERELLARMVQTELEQAQLEIHRTDHFDYRKGLEQKERTLESLRDRLGQTAPV